MAAVLSPLLLDNPSPSGAATPRPAVNAAQAADAAADAEVSAEAAARREALSRLRRGRLGTIATSARGVLSPGQSTVQRRSLLGE